MTVIAWDGHTLAADRLAVVNGVRNEACKLWYRKNRHGPALLAASGYATTALEMVKWFEDGELAERLPEAQKTEEYSNLIVVRYVAGEVKVYYYGKHCASKVPVLERQAVWGSGGDLAMGALAMGAPAAQAVYIACQHSIYCGGKIDQLTLDDLKA